MHQLLSIVELSSILCLVSLAAMLTFRMAGFPDLSVDGVFTLGSVVFAKCFVAGISVPVAILLAMLAGTLAGVFTATASVRLKINPLLASVLVLTILYSLNLRILGRANQPLYSFEIGQWFASDFLSLSFLLFAGSTVSVLYLAFRTEVGCALRCTGTSPVFLTSVGRNVAFHKLTLVGTAGMLVAASGCFLTIKYGFSDVSIGTGTIVVGIASLIIGEKICGRANLLAQILSAPVGIFLYELAVGVAMSLGVSPTDVKLATGLIAICLLSLGKTERDRLLAQTD